jgi:hypothetical protein
MCQTTWADLQEFVTDHRLRVEGYEACFLTPDWGLILLTHRTAGCGTTLAVRAVVLKPLHNGPFWTERMTGLEECLRLCLDKGRLEECTAECEMAWIRSALQWLRRHELPPHMGHQSTKETISTDSPPVAE